MKFRSHLQAFATALAFVTPAVLAPAMAQAEGKTIIVLDASGSMWGQIDGRPKLEIAREALATVLAGLPADTEMGLMAYGHREKGSCTDIELIVPPGPGTGARRAPGLRRGEGRLRIRLRRRLERQDRK